MGRIIVGEETERTGKLIMAMKGPETCEKYIQSLINERDILGKRQYFNQTQIDSINDIIITEQLRFKEVFHRFYEKR